MNTGNGFQHLHLYVLKLNRCVYLYAYICHRVPRIHWLVDWGLTSHQQLRSYGDGTSVYSPIRRTGEARDRTCDPWFTSRIHWIVFVMFLPHFTNSLTFFSNISALVRNFGLKLYSTQGWYIPHLVCRNIDD